MRRIRSLLTIVGVLWALSFASAWAKGPVFTLEIIPEEPIAGQPAELVLRAWDWTRSGEPDLSRPWNLPTPHIELRTYPADEVPHSGPEPGGSPIGLERTAPGVYRAMVVFPEPGAWVVVQPGYHSGVPDRPDFKMLEVVVITAAGESPMLAGYGVKTALFAVVGVVTAAVAGVGLLMRRRKSRAMFVSSSEHSFRSNRDELA